MILTTILYYNALFDLVLMQAIFTKLQLKEPCKYWFWFLAMVFVVQVVSTSTKTTITMLKDRPFGGLAASSEMILQVFITTP